MILKLKDWKIFNSFVQLTLYENYSNNIPQTTLQISLELIHRGIWIWNEIRCQPQLTEQTFPEPRMYKLVSLFVWQEFTSPEAIWLLLSRQVSQCAGLAVSTHRVTHVKCDRCVLVSTANGTIPTNIVNCTQSEYWANSI